jgi:hypothetical protein
MFIKKINKKLDYLLSGYPVKISNFLKDGRFFSFKNFIRVYLSGALGLFLCSSTMYWTAKKCMSPLWKLKALYRDLAVNHGVDMGNFSLLAWIPKKVRKGLGDSAMQKIKKLQAILEGCEHNALISYSTFRQMERTCLSDKVRLANTHLSRNESITTVLSVVDRFKLYALERKTEAYLALVDNTCTYSGFIPFISPAPRFNAFASARLEHDMYVAVGISKRYDGPAPCKSCIKSLVEGLLNESDTAILDCAVQSSVSMGSAGLVASLAMGGGYLVYLSACLFFKTEPCLPMTISM